MPTQRGRARRLELIREIDEADRLSLTGPAGTIIFWDTSGFHRGGLASTKPRILCCRTHPSDEAQQRHRRNDLDWSATSAESLSDASRFALE